MIPATASTCAFPFGGNGNFNSLVLARRNTATRLHVPSRSEGMETVFGVTGVVSSATLSTCAFPFGGNGNLDTRRMTGRLLWSLHVPSRSEGMETKVSYSTALMRYGLHVPSRSEGMETLDQGGLCVRTLPCCLHVPSRSEGMETSST